MTNLACVIAVLAAHRQARIWTDEFVAADLLARLRLDPAAYAPIAESEVLAHEAAAKAAADMAKVARGAFNAQVAAVPKAA